jgi:hypothetical protein
LIKSAWFEPIKKKMLIKEPEYGEKLSAIKGRLYTNSTRAGNYATINVSCGICKINYILTMQNQPEPEQNYNFKVSFQISRRILRNFQ